MKTKYPVFYYVLAHSSIEDHYTVSWVTSDLYVEKMSAEKEMNRLFKIDREDEGGEVYYEVDTMRVSTDEKKKNNSQTASNETSV